MINCQHFIQNRHFEIPFSLHTSILASRSLLRDIGLFLIQANYPNTKKFNNKTYQNHKRPAQQTQLKTIYSSSW